MFIPNKAIVPEDIQTFYSSVDYGSTLAKIGPWNFSGMLDDRVNLDATVRNQIIILGFQGFHWTWEGIAYIISHNSDNYYYELDVLGRFRWDEQELSYTSASGIIRLYTDDKTIIFNVG